jgi:hypothetical protein
MARPEATCIQRNADDRTSTRPGVFRQNYARAPRGFIMNTLSSADRSTVAKLLGLVGSHHDAEALAAARKAHQLVQERGTTWPDVLGLDLPPEPEPGHLALARDLLGRGRGLITAWEKSFLIGIMAFKTLKPKQLESLEAIRTKVTAAADAA